MALQIWLPLIGTTENKGLYPATFTNATATVNPAGKIGSCYNFAATTGNGIIYSPGTAPFTSFMETFIDNHSFSFCAWFKMSSSSTAGPLAYITYGVGFVVGTTVVFNMNNSTRSVNLTVNQAVNDNKWHHYVATYDYESNKMSLYIDGVLIGSKTYASGASYVHTWVNNFYIGRNPNTSTATCFFQGDMNDVRFYDHCLSPKEVKEIAQGLILHYPLDSTDISNPNLAVASYRRLTPNGTKSSNEFAVVTPTFDVFETYGLVPYTISFDIKADTNHSFSIYSGYGSNPKYGFPSTSVNATTEWQRFSYTFTPYISSETGTWAGIGCYGVYGSGAIVSLRNVKLELGTVETPYYIDNSTDKTIHDVSGYERNGTITIGTPAIEADTSRYGACTKFDSLKIEGPTIPANGQTDLTMACWVKLNSYTSDRTCNIITGQYLTVSVAGKLSVYAYGKAPAGYHDGTSTIPLNTWTHIAVVWNATQVRGYVNGVKEIEKTCQGTFSSTVPIKLGIENTSNRKLNGYMSDVRVYITALSDADIKELYDTATSIDDGGNLHDFECVEDEVDKAQVLKTGIVKTNNFIEFNDKLKVLEDGSVFLQILHHNNPASNLFTINNCWLNNTTDLYSALLLLKDSSWFTSLSEYEFLICEKLTSSSTESQYRWKQTSNPSTSSTLSGYSVISGSPARSCGLMNKGTYAAMHNGSSWYVACGSYSVFSGGIPGVAGVITTGYFDLYVRIPDEMIKGALSDFLKMYKKSILGKQMIER